MILFKEATSKVLISTLNTQTPFTLIEQNSLFPIIAIVIGGSIIGIIVYIRYRRKRSQVNK